LKGTRVTVRNWADLSVQLAKLLHSRHPEIFRQCLDLRTATALKTTIFTEGPPDEYRRSYREVPGSPYWVLTHGAGPGTFEERWKRIIERFGYNGTDLSLEIR